MLHLAMVCNVFEAVATGRSVLTREESEAIGRLRTHIQSEINIRRHGRRLISDDGNGTASAVVDLLVRAAKEVMKQDQLPGTLRHTTASLAQLSGETIKPLTELRSQLQGFMYQPETMWAREMYELCEWAYELSDVASGPGERVIASFNDK